MIFANFIIILFNPFARGFVTRNVISNLRVKEYSYGNS